MNEKRMLYRHPSDKVIAGVCAGVAEYFGWDPVLVRVLWVVATFMSWGGGLFAYILLALFLPTGNNTVGQLRPPALELNQKGVVWTAGILMGVGVLWLLANLGILPGLWGALWGIVAVVFWPAVLIGAGYLLLRTNNNHNIDQGLAQGARRMQEALSNALPNGDAFQAWMNQVRARILLRRSRSNRMVLGVCGGIGERLGVDANLIRLIWVAITLGSMGVGLLLYIGLAVLIPEEPAHVTTQEQVQHIQVTNSETHDR